MFAHNFRHRDLRVELLMVAKAPKFLKIANRLHDFMGKLSLHRMSAPHVT